MTLVYIDTSVLVALLLNEPKSAAVNRWYGACADEMVSAAWCVTEFASAIGIKQRTRQIGAVQAQAAWQNFVRLCANDLQLLPVDPPTFHRAAILTLDAATGLRAGDALHLAAALEARAKIIATLDRALLKNAKRLNLRPAKF